MTTHPLRRIVGGMTAGAIADVGFGVDTGRASVDRLENPLIAVA